MLIVAKAVKFLQSSHIQFIQGQHRNQTYFATLEDPVSPGNPVRLMDAFVDNYWVKKQSMFTQNISKDLKICNTGAGSNKCGHSKLLRLK